MRGFMDLYDALKIMDLYDALKKKKEKRLYKCIACYLNLIAFFFFFTNYLVEEKKTSHINSIALFFSSII